MTTIFLVFLFIIQIVGFYLLALLYTKLSKFDDLEKKQRKLMDEMDDSIGAYLAELKDENERLIERLSAREMEPVSKKRDDTTVITEQKTVAASEESKLRVNAPTIPVKLALKSYNAITAAQEPTLTIPDEREVDDDRIRAIKLHDAGASIEEIAKKLGKGRTEVELILKFR